MRSCFNQMIARNDYLGKTQLSLGIGFSVKEAENIKDSFVLANRSLAERLLEGNSKILEADASKVVLYEKKTGWTNSPEIWEVRFRHWM